MLPRLALFFVLAATGPSRAGTPPWAPLLRGGRCAAEAGRQLETWGATGEILRAPPGVDGLERFHLATREIGSWITLIARGEGPVLFRAGPGGSERAGFASDCAVEVESVETPPPAKDGFTDADLARALKKSERLVVFLWSPHMPLSVDGLPEIEAAARAAGASLVALTDPSSDRRFVDEVARENHIPSESRRPLASIELLFRDLTVHTPTILVFEGPRVSAPLPGYRNRRDYARFLDAFFAGR